jgi:hypothetical protein
MLRQLADDLWIADMEFSRLGFRFDARTTIARLASGGLWVHSPIALTDELRKAVTAMGPVEWIVAPSKMHYEHLPEWAAAFPDAETFAVPGAAGRFRSLTGQLGPEPISAWAPDLDQTRFEGSRLYDEVEFVHRPSGTLILTDLCFNIPENRSRTTRFFAGSLGILGRFNVSRTFKWSMQDPDAVKESVKRILAWDFDRVIISHGEVLDRDGKETMRRVFSWLL